MTDVMGRGINGVENDFRGRNGLAGVYSMRDQLECVDGLHVTLSMVHKAIEGFGYRFKVLKNRRRQP